MGLLSLNIQGLRNLAAVEITPSKGFNIFFGKNGSGKTSILEAIYLLGLGKSFRHHQVQPIINYHQQQLGVYSFIEKDHNKVPLGIEKNREGKTIIRLANETVGSAAVIAELLPLQLIHPESDELISGSPKIRRQFIDWGVFHVEQQFFPLWKRWQSILKQRNAALKAQLSSDQIMAWDQEYVSVSQQLEIFRENYINNLQPIFYSLFKNLSKFPELTLEYHRGWSKGKDLAKVLVNHLIRDKQLGYTYYGPQRTDITIKMGTRSASEVLSRGEQKLVAIALHLAQGILLKQLKGKQCIYLIDDLAAELDNIYRQKVAEMLIDLKSQVFITTIESMQLKELLNFANSSVFHVEEGAVKPV